MAYTTPGSVFSVAIDADGDVVAAGSKAVHANTFGNGGSVWCLDAYEQTLHVLGEAKVGGPLEVTSPGGASHTLPIPPNPSLSGMGIHFQGLRFLATGTLTNKVSVRLQ